ncbi:hypothetical protein BS47DRAFT_1383654 [Hydnum rufescens UP504]|uniref:Conserved oligomeric Golgi complex subunit 8 n=1 Tax=Hydnum rufescens UP504 TaxID=1448309 RepID=A0A9P6DUW2_9AGAM|nr:hypothetical protein BS47DRAFT_1383654 [Hydnum rufescens UP504]
MQTIAVIVVADIAYLCQRGACQAANDYINESTRTHFPVPESGFRLIPNVMVDVEPSTLEAPVTLPELLVATATPSSQAVLTSPATKLYLSHLSSLPLTTLLTEPTRLATESDLLTADLTQLCHNQHTTFLSLHSASTVLSSSLESLTTSLDSILEEWIPSLEHESRRFVENTQSIQRDRRKASLVLEHHDKLLDVLELPQLLATCVQSGYYAEALDLVGHFERNLLAVLPQTALLDSVHASVLGSMQSLLNQLLHQLRAPAKLPVLFKTVNLLRRMDVLSEDQLAVAFIQGRAANLEDAFDRATGTERHRQEDPARYLRKWIEVFREGVYDLVTQYSSIFLPLPAPTSVTALSPQSQLSPAMLRSFLTTCTSAFLTRLLTLLRTTLREIPAVDMSSVSSLITQLAYCASSFGRIGLDFRAALRPIIEDAVYDIVTRGFKDAQDAFEKEVADATRSGKRPSDWLIVPGFDLTLGSQSRPSALGFVNGILQALNSLRLVAPPSVYLRVSDALDKTLLVVSSALLTYCLSRDWGSGESSADESGPAGLETMVLGGVGRALWGGSGAALGYLREALAIGVYGFDGQSDENDVQLRYLAGIGSMIEFGEEDEVDPTGEDVALSWGFTVTKIS